MSISLPRERERENQSTILLYRLVCPEKERGERGKERENSRKSEIDEKKKKTTIKTTNTAYPSCTYSYIANTAGPSPTITQTSPTVNLLQEYS